MAHIKLCSAITTPGTSEIQTTFTSCLIGRSKAIRGNPRLGGNASDVLAPVVIEGLTGTGKEVIAPFSTEEDSWIAGEFVVIHCGRFSETTMESTLLGHEKGAFTTASNSSGLLRTGPRRGHPCSTSSRRSAFSSGSAPASH